MSRGQRMERLTTIIDVVEPPYTNPNGNRDNEDGCVHDDEISEREAKLWLLSQASRAAGGRVEFDDATQRWVVAGGVAEKAEKACEFCGKNFQLSRSDMKYCSRACKQKAVRSRTVSAISWGVSQ